MNNKGIATLDPRGYITVNDSPSDILQIEFNHMFESDHSQSSIWYGKVESFQWTIKEYAHNPEELANQVKLMIDRTYKPYFGVLESNAYVKGVEDGQYTLSVYVRATVNDVDYELGRDLFIDPERGAAEVLASLNR